MIPMLDTITAPDASMVLMTVGPAFAGVMIALVAGVAWLARGTAEELRRIAARDWERGIPSTVATRERLAA